MSGMDERWNLFSGARASGRGIDLVGEDVLREGEGHGKIEALEQLEEGLALAADEHGEAVRAIDCGGDAAHRFEHADGNLFLSRSGRRDAAEDRHR